MGSGAAGAQPPGANGGRAPVRRRHRSVAAALARVRGAPTILAALERFDDVAAAARRDTSEVSVPLLRAAIDDVSDQVTALAAVRALAAVPDPIAAPAALVGLLHHWRPDVREHAAWALASAPVDVRAIPLLADLVCQGGFTGTLAQWTLETWAEAAPTEVLVVLHACLSTPRPQAERVRLVDTLGLVPGPRTTAILSALAADPREGSAIRSAAEAALAGSAVPAGIGRGQEPRGSADGLTVAQVFLHADIDGSLSHAGQGDTGGIATLLVSLGDALLEGDHGVRRVLTISRGRSGAPLPGDAAQRPGHHYLTIPLGGPLLHTGNAWPLRVAARRGLAAILAAAGPVDVVHLRMADVGSWVAADLADALGTPTVLTMAPDPHALIEAREAAGTLTRATFGDADAAEHLVFRVRLLRHLADRAGHIVVFPRPHLGRDLRRLLHLDLSDRVTAVPEGIDLEPFELAVAEVAAANRGGDVPDTVAELDTLLATLPPDRRGLPLAITVGRLHPVKGMATLVEAWDERLRDRCNLLVVGGDLDDPNAEELAQLARIDAVADRAAAPARGLLLPGHRPNATVARWLAAALLGRPGLAAPGGVYVSASLKEEFGIAILEAMAAGLLVVAPRSGGPATYVDDGVTGVLADTGSGPALAAAVARAIELAAAPGAAERSATARAMVRERFGIGTMAASLGAIYREVAAGRAVP